MILNNKVLQKLEIIGFKESVKKSTSRIQVQYNHVRPHSYNNYETPYEARYGVA